MTELSHGTLLQILAPLGVIMACALFTGMASLQAIRGSFSRRAAVSWLAVGGAMMALAQLFGQIKSFGDVSMTCKFDNSPDPAELGQVFYLGFQGDRQCVHGDVGDAGTFYEKVAPGQYSRLIVHYDGTIRRLDLRFAPSLVGADSWLWRRTDFSRPPGSPTARAVFTGLASPKCPAAGDGIDASNAAAVAQRERFSRLGWTESGTYQARCEISASEYILDKPGS